MEGVICSTKNPFAVGIAFSLDDEQEEILPLLSRSADNNALQYGLKHAKKFMLSLFACISKCLLASVNKEPKLYD